MRNYQRITKKGDWTAETLKKAMKNVRENGMSIRTASMHFNIPFTTLQNRLKSNTTSSAKFGRNAVLSSEEEKPIAEHLIKMSRMFYGLTKIELRRAVYSYATANNIRNPFNDGKKMAGRDWLNGFLKRNKTISVRKPEATSINRITAFNKIEVGRFYENLENVMKTFNFPPDRIYNVDETGVGVVHRPAPILAEKGVKQVGAATSAERGKTHTACCAISASGSFVPPMIIFPRKRMTPKLMIDGPAGAIYRCSKSGWINEGLFLEWLQHFVKQTNASKENPVLLIMDNHTSHISVESYNFCISNGIHVVTLPPHTSHKLQPLDRSIFGPLQKQFDVESEIEMKKHTFEKLTSEQIPSLFRKSWVKISCADKAINGFESTGICPFNPNIFKDHEYYQLESEEATTEPQQSVTDHCDEPEETTHEVEETMDNFNTVDELDDNESTQPSQVMDSASCSKSTEKISFLTFSPLPIKKNTTKKKQGRSKQHSEIITAPLFKAVLEEKQRKKEIREQKKTSEKPTKAMKTGVVPSTSKQHKRASQLPKKIQQSHDTPKKPRSVKTKGVEIDQPKHQGETKAAAEIKKLSVTSKKPRSVKTKGVEIDQRKHQGVTKAAAETKKRSVTSKKPRSVKTDGDETALVVTDLSFEHELQSQDVKVIVQSTALRMKRRIVDEDAIPQVALNFQKPKRFRGRKESKKFMKGSAIASTETNEPAGESVQDNELLDGLCYLCGEKYEAEFFVCATCNNCVHINCSSVIEFASLICKDCIN